MPYRILDSLDDGERAVLLAGATRRRFSRREALFRQGDPGDTVHFVERGLLAVRIETRAGHVTTVDVLGSGDVVGLFAVLDETGRRSATVSALEPAETLSLDRGQFTTLRRAHPSVDQFAIAALTAEIRRVDGLLLEAFYGPVATRIARRLLTLASRCAPGAEIPVTQEDLSSLAGSSRASANRFLRQLEAAGTVSLSRHRIRLVDPSALAEHAR